MSASPLDKLKELLGLVRGRAAELKSDFDEESKFQKMRIIIVGIFLADVLAMLVIALILVEGRADFEVWLESGGPSNIVMIKNGSDDAFDGVELRIDAKYSAKVEMRPDSNGFPVDTTFSDKNGFGPPRDYRPRRIEISVDGEHYDLPVGKKR